MSAAVAEPDVTTDTTCRVCREYPPRPECYLVVQGAEEPVCRLCWEQAVLDPRRVARRLNSPSTSLRYRTI